MFYHQGRANARKSDFELRLFIILYMGCNIQDNLQDKQLNSRRQKEKSQPPQSQPPQSPHSQPPNSPQLSHSQQLSH